MEKPSSGDVYKDHKGSSYMILFVGTHAETSEELVIYRPFTSYIIWVRPLSTWNDTIEYEGQTVKRFTLHKQ